MATPEEKTAAGGLGRGNDLFYKAVEAFAVVGQADEHPLPAGFFKAALEQRPQALRGFDHAEVRLVAAVPPKVRQAPN